MTLAVAVRVVQVKIINGASAVEGRVFQHGGSVPGVGGNIEGTIPYKTVQFKPLMILC